MRLIYHRHHGTDSVLRIHLDERHVVKEDDPRLEEDGFPFSPGDPDPDWVREYVFGIVPQEELPITGTKKGSSAANEHRRMTQNEIDQQNIEEAAALARDELERASEAAPLKTEGMKLT